MRLLASLVLVSALIPFPVVAASIVSVRALWAQTGAGFDFGPAAYTQICTVNSIHEDVGLWLTANHCLEHGPVWVEQPQPDGRESAYHIAVVVYTDKDNDLGVLNTSTLRVVSLKLAKEGLSVGDNVSMAGYPMGLRVPQHMRGTVASVDTEVIVGGINYGHKTLFDMGVCQGHSGSAVLNAAGEVVSVMQIGPGSPCSPLSGGATYSRLRASVAQYFKS